MQIENRNDTSGVSPRRTHHHKRPPAYARLGSRLRARRLQLELSLGAVARMTGLPKGNLCSYEFGSLVPGPKILGRLATALDLNIVDLWRLRASTLVAMEGERLLHRVRLMVRQSIAIIERSISDTSDLRIRRPEPIDEPQPDLRALRHRGAEEGVA
jgi:transcriptional regulator with XRE-family HTH domain